jgi:type III pantothenate kinase
MILCDIGNTTVDWDIHGEYSKQSIDNFDPNFFSETIYYICVNTTLTARISHLNNWIDVTQYIEWTKYYPTMGIDRVMACEAINNGVIVDAGSAVTVDVMRDGCYEGGFIALGLRSMQKAYAKLSPALAWSFNFEVDLTIMAKNTPDAITIGYLAPLIDKIKSLGSPIIVTGGDSNVFSSLLDNSTLDSHLVFKGMKKLIEKGQLC